MLFIVQVQNTKDDIKSCIKLRNDRCHLKIENPLIYYYNYYLIFETDLDYTYSFEKLFKRKVFVDHDSYEYVAHNVGVSDPAFEGLFAIQYEELIYYYNMITSPGFQSDHRIYRYIRIPYRHRNKYEELLTGGVYLKTVIELKVWATNVHTHDNHHLFPSRFGKPLNIGYLTFADLTFDYDPKMSNYSLFKTSKSTLYFFDKLNAYMVHTNEFYRGKMTLMFNFMIETTLSMHKFRVFELGEFELDKYTDNMGVEVLITTTPLKYIFLSNMIHDTSMCELFGKPTCAVEIKHVENNDYVHLESTYIGYYPDKKSYIYSRIDSKYISKPRIYTFLMPTNEIICDDTSQSQSQSEIEESDQIISDLKLDRIKK